MQLHRVWGTVMSRYAKGARAERRTMRVLEAAGYRAHRFAGSHGEWDVVAFGPFGVRLIQCKAGTARPTALEREAMQLYLVPSYVTREVWRWPDRAREPIVEVL